VADTHAQASRPATPVDVSVYRAALYLCPPAFRREFAPQMIRDFDEARQEAAVSGDARRRLWPFRARMTGDLVKTAVWQWLRTGWPVIVALAMTTSLAAAAALASLWPRAVFPLSLDSPDADVMAWFAHERRAAEIELLTRRIAVSTARSATVALMLFGCCSNSTCAEPFCRELLSIPAGMISTTSARRSSN